MEINAHNLRKDESLLFNFVLFETLNLLPLHITKWFSSGVTIFSSTYLSRPLIYLTFACWTVERRHIKYSWVRAFHRSFEPSFVFADCMPLNRLSWLWCQRKKRYAQVSETFTERLYSLAGRNNFVIRAFN